MPPSRKTLLILIIFQIFVLNIEQESRNRRMSSSKLKINKSSLKNDDFIDSVISNCAMCLGKAFIIIEFEKNNTRGFFIILSL